MTKLPKTETFDLFNIMICKVVSNICLQLYCQLRDFALLLTTSHLVNNHDFHKADNILKNRSGDIIPERSNEEEIEQ